MPNQYRANVIPARVRRIGIVVFVALCVSHLASQPSGVVAAEPSARARASELVSQLGHEEFAMRERAAAELITLELDAVAAVRVGTKSPNREIRHRSEKLFTLISEIDLERRVKQFKNDTDPERDYGLPGWDAYREVVGDGSAARSLFVAMHEDESRLLSQIEAGPDRLRDVLDQRCEQLRTQPLSEGVQVPIGTTATLLFIATRDGVEVSSLVRWVVYHMACSNSTFEAEIANEPLQDALVTLTERWIAREPLGKISFALHLGLSNGLKGSLLRAREVFESPVTSVFDRTYASLCLTKFGDESDMTRLETYLEDITICVRDQLDGQAVVTEIRDLALAGLVQLAKQEPKDFGFDRLEIDRRSVFNLSSLGFRDEQSRVQAIAAWREYRRSKVDAKTP